jgi:hypothetical protein
MVVENVRCLLREESSDTCEIICHKSSRNVNKVAFWLPYKMLITYNCTYCQKASDKIDVSGNQPMNNFLDAINVH